MSKAIISVDGLGKRYQLGATVSHDMLRDQIVHGVKSLLRIGPDERKVDEFWALREVSFDVQEGEVLGIIGRNGAGKSTLLKILSKITEPTEGEIRVRGRVASLLEVGTGFHPELTGRENIFLNGAILGMSRVEIKSKFDEIVEFSGVAKFIDTPVKRYSSGMYVRLAFAVAAHLEPEILVIDEVLAVGDIEFQKKCLGKMGEVARSGRTVLFVSHNMASVVSLCDKGLLLADGRTALLASAKEATAEYLSNHEQHQQGVYQASDTHRDEMEGRFFIESAKASSASELGVGCFPCGTDICFEVECSMPEANRGTVGVGIQNQMGVRLLTLHSRTDRDSIVSSSGHCRLRCLVKNVSLVPGNYTVKVSLDDLDKQEADVIEEAFIFQVVDSEETKKIFLRERGLCVFEQEWEIET